MPTLQRLSPLLLLLAVAGCETIDPYASEGHWRPVHANDTNLRIMVANPLHLVRGAEPDPVDAVNAAAAVNRMHRNRIQPLPASGVANVVMTGQEAPRAPE